MSAHTGANPKKEMTKKKLNLIGRALEDKTLTPSSKVVLTQLLLKHHNDETAQCNPSQRTLAHALALSQSQVKRAVRQLKECGWLICQQQFNKSNQHSFNWDRVRSMGSAATH